VVNLLRRGFSVSPFYLLLLSMSILGFFRSLTKFDIPTKYHQALDLDSKPLFTCPACNSQFHDYSWNQESKTYPITCPHCHTTHTAFVYWHKHFDTSFFDVRTWFVVGIDVPANILSRLP
jgi:hypothetical protein